MHQPIHYNMGSKSAIGIGNGICFKQVRDKGGGSYIDPLVRNSIVGLWKCDQNTNESPTRNIIKNTIKDKGGDLELLNFGYKLNSGYNGYVTDFTEWKSSNTNITQTKITVSKDINFPVNLASFENATNAPSFRIKVSGLPKGQNLYYKYINEEGLLEEKFNIPSDGIYTLPATAVSDTPTTVATLVNEQYNINIKGLTIEQLPLYEGALVTDGTDDMIVSQKTVQEMLGGSNVCTVVSMIHQINLSTVSSTTSINSIRSESVAHVCARHLNTAYGKTGIFGYSKQLNTTNNPTLINNILGDKKDYIAEGNTVIDTTDKYFVQGYLWNDSLQELSEVAVYWTFIANKVLTTDEINQIIGYYKLDKYVTPQVIYDVKRQGLSNDTPEADWYLKDFSGNGHDMQLYNFAKKLGSRIGKYEVDFNTWIPQSYVADSTYTSNKLHITNIKGSNAILYTKKGMNAMKVKITGIQSFNLVYRYIAENDVWEALEVDRDGIYELPASTTTTKTYYTGFTVPYYTGDCDITIEQIPDYEGALVSDGIDDYGKVENLPIYKDYTVAIDRAWTNDLVKAQCLTSKLNGNNFGSFNFELIENGFSSYSFGTSNKGVITIDSNKKISYQSKYVYNGSPIISGNNVDGKDLFLFRSRDSYPYYAEAAIWSYILFPYSLSEFLIERQLKRYKLGTLYPNMVEFRPVIKSNASYDNIVFYYKNEKVENGTYLTVGSSIGMHIRLSSSSVNEVKSITVNGIPATFKFHDANNIYQYDFNLTSKSPQKIDITIDEYIRYEDIVQPYPAIINLKQDGKTITWGDKLKVGSDIVFAGSANLLPELYTVSETRYNGVTLYPNTIIKVEKSMVFNNARTYTKANEPSCILSPNRLRIPNSSYKILRYIPDLTGKGNHGRLNNFAYAGMSGANGYVEDFTKWRISKSNIVSTISDSSIHFTHIGVNYEQTIAIFEAQATSNKKYNIKVRISGLTSNMRCFFNNTNEHSFQELVNGVNEISVDLIVGWYGFNINTLDGSVIGDCDITIQQIGEHEGSICFDGTDDHITISNIIGGKCIMAKVTVNRNNGIIYDQRRANVPNKSWMQLNPSSVIFEQNAVSTYIDGILNHNVTGSDLVSKTVTLTCELEIGDTSGTYQPTIGSSYAVGYTTNINLYEFMLFPDVPDEEEIKKLNDVMGIEGGYVESPNYYWDSFGKKNTDTDRNLIADQVSKDVTNVLEVKNVAYNNESGYTDDNGLLLDGVEDYAINTVIPAVTDFTVIGKRNILDYKSCFTVKGGNTTSTAAFVLEYGSDKFYNFGGVNTVEYPNTITVATKSSYNNNPAVSSQGIDSLGLRIGEYENYYSKLVFYKLMFYTKTIDQLSINMLKNLFERDELIDITNPIFKKDEL